MESSQDTIRKVMEETILSPVEESAAYTLIADIEDDAAMPGDTFAPLSDNSIIHAPFTLSENNSESEPSKQGRSDRMLTFDLHPLYAAILQDGASIRQGEVLGLDGDLRRVLVAPYDGTIRLLVTGTGVERRVRVFLSEQKERRETFAAGRR